MSIGGIVRASAGRGGVRWGCTRRWGCFTTTASDTGPAPESAPWPIGLITLGAKRTGKRRTGNPFAPFEVAGAGDGLTANLHGHEAGNGGYSQGEPTGHRASPRPYVRPGKAGAFSGRESHRGKSQEPRSWTAGWRETETLKPVDKPIVRMGSESLGRNERERTVASKVGSPRGRARFRRAKAAWIVAA
jgi:hypothetical protein